MRAAVTGGAGFIGHHLVRGLVAAGHHVAVIDDFSTGDRARLAPFGDRVAITNGSILDPAALQRALAGSEVVFHQAAIASVVRSNVEPLAVNDVNVAGTIEVMLGSARAGARRVVLAGSSAVYGAVASLPCRESQRAEPQSPYGAGKLAAEHYLHALGRLHGVQTVALRYFNVYGPGQDPSSEYAAVVPRFITALLEGREPVIYGSDQISRDFVFIDDVVQSNLLAAGADQPTGVTCNIASGHATTLRDLLNAVCDAVGRRVEPRFAPPRPGDIQHSRADIALAMEILGFRPSIDLAQGIARTVAWFRDRKP